jgi:hypothetical protein
MAPTYWARLGAKLCRDSGRARRRAFREGCQMSGLVTVQSLLRGAVYSLEQCGLLLGDAKLLYENGSYATALAVAALPAKTLGAGGYCSSSASESSLAKASPSKTSRPPATITSASRMPA